MAKPIIILAGPTASGKSALALDIAKSIDAVIINCDSKQVFREIPIITAQPSEPEKHTIEHRLYGNLSVTEHCSVADWMVMAKKAITAVQDAHKVPLLVGGTGLYIKAITHGISPVPEIPEEVRNSVRERFNTLGNTAFFDELAAKDPSAAQRLSPGDSQRTQRAYEVIEHTGKSLTQWQNVPNIHYFPDTPKLTFFLSPSREETYARCNGRFEQMVSQGALEEAQQLEAMQLNETLPAAKAHGVPELRAYIRGDMTLDEAITQAQRNTRHYIKRQFTWFRGQMHDAMALTTHPYTTMLDTLKQFL